MPNRIPTTPTHSGRPTASTTRSAGDGRFDGGELGVDPMVVIGGPGRTYRTGVAFRPGRGGARQPVGGRPPAGPASPGGPIPAANIVDKPVQAVVDENHMDAVNP